MGTIDARHKPDSERRILRPGHEKGQPRGSCDPPSPFPTTPMNTSQLIRTHASIPMQLNERFKAMARRQNKTAHDFIGEMLMQLAPVLDRMEAQIEAERLRERFGDEWLNVLQQVEPENIPSGSAATSLTELLFR